SGGALEVGLASTPDAVTFAGTASAQSIAVRTARAFTGQALNAATTITVTSTGTGTGAGPISMGALSAGGNITLNGNGSVTTGAITSTGGALAVGVNSAPTSVTFTGDVSARSIDVRTPGAVVAEGLNNQGNLVLRNLTSTAGDVTVNSASIRAGAVTATRVGNVGGAIRLRTTGTGANGILNVGALLADLGIELDSLGAITTGAMTARNGAVDVDGASITVNGATSATGGNVRLLASGAITTGALTSVLANNAGGAIDVDSTNSGTIITGALTTTGGGISLDTLGSVTVNGTITAGTTTRTNLTIGTDTNRASAITLNGAVNAANVTLRTRGLSITNAINVGNGNVDIGAANIDLLGAVTAGTGTVTLKSFDNGTIGLGSGAGTMSLTDTELGRVSAARLLIDAGTGNITIAGVTFQPAAGSANVDIATTGTIAITGDINATGMGRTFRLGGTAAGAETASRIIGNIETANINLGTAALDLRGTDIVFGQASLIQSVFGATSVGAATSGQGTRLTISELVRQFIANPQSQLYTAQGLAASKQGQPFITAGTMRVTYGGTALFQNTAPRSGGAAFEGVKLGSLASPSTPALSLNPLTSPTVEPGKPITNGNAFAIFGSINGAINEAAALAGDTVITVNNKVVAPASRVNGCIIGSAAGCVTTIVGNFVLTVPREVVSPIVADEGAPLAFDPLVGTNNESLFSDAAAPQGDGEECRERDAAGVCVGN
ncbi:MAG: hypothetical protein KAF27_06110, partial [Porphyrobacter sp.]|nr:hypothetical protein [Porphyrobacter sp.]